MTREEATAMLADFGFKPSKKFWTYSDGMFYFYKNDSQVGVTIILDFIEVLKQNFSEDEYVVLKMMGEAYIKDLQNKK